MGRYSSITIGAVLLPTWIVGLLILAAADTSANPERAGPWISAAETPGPRIRAHLSGLAGGGEQASIRPWPVAVKDGGWRMVATTRDAWLYSTKTGKVYRVLSPKDCDAKDGPQGCLVPLPAIHGPQRIDELPSAADDY